MAVDRFVDLEVGRRNRWEGTVPAWIITSRYEVVQEFVAVDGVLEFVGGKRGIVGVSLPLP